MACFLLIFEHKTLLFMKDLQELIQGPNRLRCLKTKCHSFDVPKILSGKTLKKIFEGEFKKDYS